jgi:hypothetical protein
MSQLDPLDEMLRDARIMSGQLFYMVYGAYRIFAPDNSIRVFSFFKEPKVTPYFRPVEHKTKPRKKDIVAVFTGDDKEYGHICWLSEDDDAVCVFMYNRKATETFLLSSLESHFGDGKTRWRIIQ